MKLGLKIVDFLGIPKCFSSSKTWDLPMTWHLQYPWFSPRMTSHANPNFAKQCSSYRSTNREDTMTPGWHRSFLWSNWRRHFEPWHTWHCTSAGYGNGDTSNIWKKIDNCSVYQSNQKESNIEHVGWKNTFDIKLIFSLRCPWKRTWRARSFVGQRFWSFAKTVTMRWKPCSVETQTVIPSPTCQKHATPLKWGLL